MKKKVFLTAFAAALVLMCGTCSAQDISVKLNGSVIDFQDRKPVVSEGRTLIPLRGLFDKMGFDIAWAADTKTVTLTKDSDLLSVVIGEKKYYLNGVSHEMDVPAQIINGYTMLPLRAIADATGANVFWDGGEKLVTIVYNDGDAPAQQEGMFTADTEQEENFILGIVNATDKYNAAAGEYLESFAVRESEGVHSAEDAEKLQASALNMRDTALKAKNAVAALDCPERFKDLADAFTKYMDSVAEMAQYNYDHAMDSSIAPEDEAKYEQLASELISAEEKYNEIFAQMAN
ncbi:MAG: copper amine oxidase N-terminal domain-containing protein [Firmicutes bacterium]|nr:copper amine oxidase N-terminal domain-containing protein [Bacillota bacterium]